MAQGQKNIGSGSVHLVGFLEFGLMNQGGARMLRLLSFIHLRLRMDESMNSHPHAKQGTTS
jgi:hypothetical protein